MRKIQIITLSLGLILSTTGQADEVYYTVKTGDTFSKIVERFFPDGRIYGLMGNLKKVIEFNLEIKNANLIFPNQVIKFQVITEKKKEEREEIRPIISPEPIINIIPKKHYRANLVGASYGMKYVSLSQSGILGDMALSFLFFNDLKLNSEFTYDDWIFAIAFERYKFSYVSLNAYTENPIYAFDIGAYYKWVMGNLNLEESPLLINHSGSIRMVKQKLMYFSLGAKKDIELSANKLTKLKFKAWFSYPLKDFTKDSQIEFQSASGFALKARVDLERKLFEKKGRTLFANGIADVSSQNISQKIRSGTTEGTAKSKTMSSSVTIGLELKF